MIDQLMGVGSSTTLYERASTIARVSVSCKRGSKRIVDDHKDERSSWFNYMASCMETAKRYVIIIIIIASRQHVDACLL